ncbi:MAG: ABC transporter permease [Gemmatimonadales bacterium]|nr:ABC transporter permease [Gemmatimonadales bacterium]
MNLLWREALLAFRRTRTLSALSVTTIAFALFVSGLFGLVALNMRAAISRVEERVEVIAFVHRGTPTQTLTVAGQDIAAFPEVLTVSYVSEEDALERARAELVEFEDAYKDLEVNPLPASLELRLKPGFRDAASAGNVAERLRSFEFVEDVRYGEDWVHRLDTLRKMAALIGLGIGLAFALVSIVIIGVTIRMTVLQRAREIQIMRLVGATDWFIRGPFLLEGAIKGFLGGLIAVGLCAAVFGAFRAQSIALGTGLLFFGPAQAVLLLIFGVLLGFGGSLFSVGRHLRNV